MADAPKHALITEETQDVPKKPRLWIIPLVLFALAVAVYGAGVVYFSTHFLPNTTVEGDDVSLKPTSYLADLVSSRSSSYRGTFQGKGFEIPFTAADIDFTYDGEKYVNEAMAQQNALLWPL
ncbi:MAG TPA: hypothetical protein PK071_06940, partial [Atopobiaceae bacterium]|nr:hypothetical protein [Atopobiaceae bacterium]